MLEELAKYSFEASSNPSEVSPNSPQEVSIEGSDPSLKVRPKSAKEISAEYGVTDKTVQTWFKTVCAAYLWLDPLTLKTGSGNKVRYSPLCQDLISQYRNSSADLSEKDWIVSIHVANPEHLSAASMPQKQEAVPLSPTEVLPTEVLPQEDDYSAKCDRPGEPMLHPGISLSLPTISEIIPSGNDTAYLTQAQQKLKQFEALQQQVIAQMQQQHEQAQSLNAQYQEATSLSDQLLLQEFQLKGVQLGYTALQLKQQAFKATVQAAESGSLTLPGKPPSGNDRSPSS